MSDKKENIDKFVKKAVEHYDVQYDEAHWEMMEKRLDEEMPIGALPHTGLDIKTILISGLSFKNSTTLFRGFLAASVTS